MHCRSWGKSRDGRGKGGRMVTGQGRRAEGSHQQIDRNRREDGRTARQTPPILRHSIISSDPKSLVRKLLVRRATDPSYSRPPPSTTTSPRSRSVSGLAFVLNVTRAEERQGRNGPRRCDTSPLLTVRNICPSASHRLSLVLQHCVAWSPSSILPLLHLVQQSHPSPGLDG